jgi:hypothetical protein
MVLIRRGADDLGITIKSSRLSLSLDVRCWMVMFKDGSGNDAWYMYMTVITRLTEMRDMSAFSISASNNNDDDDIL